MADISKIKLPSGSTYDIKDVGSRGSIEAIKSAVDAINSAVGANTDRREGSGSVSYSSSSIIIPDIHLRGVLYKIDITLARTAQYGPVYFHLKHSDGTVLKTFEISANETTYSENFDTVYMEETGCYIEVQKYSSVLTPIACTVVFDKQYQTSDNISKKLDAPAEDGTEGQVLATDGNGNTEWVDQPEMPDVITGVHVGETTPTDPNVQIWLQPDGESDVVGIEAEATQLPAGSAPTAEFDATGDVLTLQLGLPAPEKGDRGDTVIIATKYEDLTFPVAEGTYCLYNNLPYVANQAISSSEAWTAAHWDQVSFEDEIGELKNAIQNIADETPANTNILPPDQEFGYYSDTNGTPVDSQYHIRSANAIKIPAATGSLFLKFNATASGYTAIAYYRGVDPTADNYISTTSIGPGETSGQSTVPTGAKYFRVWVSHPSFSLANLSVAVTLAAPYVPYSPIFQVHMENLPGELSNYDDTSYTFDKTLHQWSELGATTDGYILENGTRAASSYLRISRYISVNAGDTVTAYGLNLNIGGTTIYGIACYDEDYNFIPNEGIKGNTSSVSGSFTVPTNCKYVAICDLKSSSSTFSVDEYTHDFGKKITENTKRVSLNELSGKTICNFGDSIFGQARPPVDVSTFLAEKTGATVYNCGFGGCRMGYHSNENYDKFSMYRLADAIASGDFSAQATAAQVSGMPSYFAATVTLLQSIDFSTVDIITISYGTNDFADGLRLGGDNSYSTDWALGYSIQTILTAYPNIRIFVCVPFYRVWLSGGTFDEDSNTKEVTSWVGGGVYKLTDFVQAEKDVCKSTQTPVLDTYYDLGINRYNWTQYFPANDGTHQNVTGRKLIAEYLATHLW